MMAQYNEGGPVYDHGGGVNEALVLSNSGSTLISEILLISVCNFRKLQIPFKNERHARIAYQVLSVDREPKRSLVWKELKVVGKNLEVDFLSKSVKGLRASMSSFLDHVILCQDTIKEFEIIPGASIPDELKELQ